jgi:serine/threonine protein kinase
MLLSFIIMEMYKDGDLLTAMKNGNINYNYVQKLDLVQQLSTAILHLHSENVIHCDIALR